MILASGKLGNSDVGQGALSTAACVARDALRFIQPPLSPLVKARPGPEGSRQHIGALLTLSGIGIPRRSKLGPMNGSLP